MGLVCGASRCALGARAYGRAAMADLAAFAGLVRHWHGVLFLLRRAPEQAGAAAQFRHQTFHERLKR